MNRDARMQALRDRLERIDQRTERLWAKGEFRDFEVWRAPTERLYLNPSNRRFRAERQAFERALARPLDPTASAQDERSIISLLLDDDPRLDGDEVKGREGKDARALIVDWETRRQERPLWVRPDGFVSNGNRRLAMLKRLAADRGRDGYDWVDVIVLGDEFDDQDLFEMEAREQLTEGLKVRYTDLNLLLTLKDAAEREAVDWQDPESLDVVSRRIQPLVGNNPQYARVQLGAVKYMREYLDYVGRPGEYDLLTGQVERFRDLGKNMTWVARNDASHEADMLELLFSAVQAGSGHLDLRALRRLLQSDQADFEAVAAEVRDVEDQETSEGEPIPAGVRSAPLDDEEESLDDDLPERPGAPAATSAGYPKAAVKRVVDLAVRRVREQDNDDAQLDIRSAADLLAKVAPELTAELVKSPQGERVRRAVEVIAAWTSAAERALEQLSEPPGS